MKRKLEQIDATIEGEQKLKRSKVDPFRGSITKEKEGEQKPKEQKQALTTVVRLKRHKGQVVQDCDVYIGRTVTRGGWNLPKSKWANPFTIKICGTAEKAAEKYEAYVKSTPELIGSIKELKGKRLGCWCKPKKCHGDILARLANELEVTDE